MKEAVTNAPIMHACKQYPNSVGAALADRASNYGTAASAIFNQKKFTFFLCNRNEKFDFCNQEVDRLESFFRL